MIRRRSGNKGFTLVELAIVMTIIGLLIGGVLKGQELVANARVASTTAQVNGYKAAIAGFRDIYSFMPGDVPNAHLRIPGCTPGCSVSPFGNINVGNYSGNGDGVIGRVTAGSQEKVFVTLTPTQGPNIATNAAWEGINFWTHLLLTNLISGVTSQGIREEITQEFGVTHPKSQFGGGFIAGTASGINTYGTPAGMMIPNGLALFLVRTPTIQPWAAAGYANGNVLRPRVAAQIDRKMDDGAPGSGDVRGGGDPAATADDACYITGTGTRYNEDSNREVCKLIFLTGQN